MPYFNIIKETRLEDTFRNNNIISTYDLDIKNKLIEEFKGNIEIDENDDWKIGLIVGGSGTGKTTILNEVFPNTIYKPEYQQNHSIIDDMPEDKSITEITKVLSLVGLSTPPLWLKPYHVLSNGEKMRVDLAKILLSENPITSFDEFTSVVDRTIAKTTSLAIHKLLNKKEFNKKFIAVSCHHDILEWLQPDWVYNTDTDVFFLKKTGKNQNSKYKSIKFLIDLVEEYGHNSVNIII